MHRDEHGVGLNVEFVAFNSQEVVREVQPEVLASVALHPRSAKFFSPPLRNSCFVSMHWFSLVPHQPLRPQPLHMDGPIDLASDAFYNSLLMDFNPANTG